MNACLFICFVTPDAKRSKTRHLVGYFKNVNNLVNNIRMLGRIL